MKTTQKNAVEQLNDFKAGKFENPSREVQCEAGWYDWFCRDTSLAGKTKKLYRQLGRISKSPKIDLETSYIFFKNNCPCVGKLYDDFRICDLKTGDVIFTVAPKSGHAPYNGEVWGKENDFKGPIFTGSWKEIVAWFMGGVE